MTKTEISKGSAYHLLHPKLTVLVTSSGENDKNIITLAWAIPTSINPPLIAISVGNGKHSYNLIKESEEFVVNIPSKELLEETTFCGSKSGSSVDKFEETGLIAEDSSKMETPKIEQCSAHIECELFDDIKTGDHTIFIGKILSASAEEEYFDKKSGIYDMNKFKPILHVGGSKFVTSKENID